MIPEVGEESSSQTSTVETQGLRTKLTETPPRAMLTLLAIVYVAEAAVMFALPVLLPPHVGETAEAFADASLLTVMICPAVWWLLIHPLRSHALHLVDLNQRLSGEITRRLTLEKCLRHQALHDPLTDLPNRAFFIRRVESALQRKKQSPDYNFAVLFIDLDHFKAINDNLGHAIGDRVLIQVTQRLETILRPGDLVARIGGDEFTVLVEGMKETCDAIKVAERIIDQLSISVSSGENDSPGASPQLHISASVGIAEGETRYEHADEILRNADMAMYRAKSHGRKRFEIFEPALQ